LRNVHDVADLQSFDVAHTMPLRGILALSVVAMHVQMYFHFQHPNLFYHTGAESVAVFFFISGYGLMKSYLRKGNSYLDGFLKKRFGRILPLFISLTAINTALRMWLNKESLWYILAGIPHQYPLKFAWFMYAISFLYVVFFCVARHVKNGKSLLIGMTISVLLYMLVCFLLPFQGYFWYHTIISSISGFAVAYYEPQLQKWVVKHKITTMVILVAVWLLIKIKSYYADAILDMGEKTIHVLFATPILNEANWIPYLMLMVVYTIGMTQNKILYFLGQISMEIYLFHGLYTQIGLWLNISNFWVGCIFVYALSISSAVLLWKIQQWYQSKSLKTE
jgi:peptidoglycan/LPS O-acetylase OafA/YrhL